MLWPALDLTGVTDADLALAAVDEFAPAAAEERPHHLRIFFPTPQSRDAALAALSACGQAAERIDVDDEDWARRSQAGLRPVTVGRMTVFPNPESLPDPESRTASTISIVIQPSMGFGTGHHATTRLCLAALQRLALAGCSVTDIGTGSGVLAIAAARLGASPVLGLDVDADAVQSARENLALNPDAANVEFSVADLREATLEATDVVVANLTGTLLTRSANLLIGLVRDGGTLVASGLLTVERQEVRDGFAGLRLDWEQEEDGWLGLAFTKPCEASGIKKK